MTRRTKQVGALIQKVIAEIIQKKIKMPQANPYNKIREDDDPETEAFAKGELSMSDSVYSYYPDGLPSEKWSLISIPGLLDSNIVKKSNLNDGHVFYDWDHYC